MLNTHNRNQNARRNAARQLVARRLPMHCRLLGQQPGAAAALPPAPPYHNGYFVILEL